MDYDILRAAVRDGNLFIVTNLLNQGGTEIKLKSVEEIFSLVGEVTSVEMMKLLLKHFDSSLIDFSKKYNFSLLTYAIYRQKPLEIIKELISAGGDINRHDGLNKTPLIKAIDSHMPLSYVEGLILLGADVNKCSEERRLSPLHFCRTKDMLSLLIKYGANVNAKSYNDITPLMHSIIFNSNHLEIIRLYLNNGADVNSKDENGRTPLMYAFWYHSNIEVVSELIKRGANIQDTDIGGNGMLHYACSAESVQILVDVGLHINNKNNIGQTPLMKAVDDFKELEVINALLRNGADPNCTDTDLNSPLHVAPEDEFVNLLISYGAKVCKRNKYNHLPLQAIIEGVEQETIHGAIIKHSLLTEQQDVYIYLSNTNYTDYVDKCKKEIDKMKNISLTSSITLYNFCTSTISKYKFIDISDVINLNNDISGKQMEEKFPMFYDVIQIKINKNKNANRKYNLVKKLDSLIISINEQTEQVKLNMTCNNEKVKLHTVSDDEDECIELDYDCLDSVASYLNYNQISNLLIASL
ncbi:uncharacterized protein LOC142326061 [Lycorma delicatula]|uniref:uncharacterized protein LOC142326061 n=1 Tax=Lycorma delicatula TaxID=130591 RepID=UPI003F512AA1